jgi:hypothetical protein
MSRRLFMSCAVFLFLIPASAANAQTTDIGIDALKDFLNLTGWNNAPKIQSARAFGEVEQNGKTHALTIKIDRRGRLRSEIPDLKLVMVATPFGGWIRRGEELEGISPGQATQLGASALIPIFSPVVEYDGARVLAAYAASDGTSVTVSVAKRWTSGDGNDSSRELGQLALLTFATKEKLLTRLTLENAVPEYKQLTASRSYEYSDYREVGSVLLPFTIREFFAGHLVQTVRFSSIAFGALESDSEFNLERGN